MWALYNEDNQHKNCFLFHLIKIKYKIPYVLAGPIASKREKTSLKSPKRLPLVAKVEYYLVLFVWQENIKNCIQMVVTTETSAIKFLFQKECVFGLHNLFWHFQTPARLKDMH